MAAPSTGSGSASVAPASSVRQSVVMRTNGRVKARRALKRLMARSHAAYRWTRRASTFGKYLCGRPHEADFAAFRCFPDRNGLFLDIGANSGESALSFRHFKPTAPIFSIEPNRYHEPDLRFLKRWIGNFDYLMCAAGDKNGRATLYVPVYKALPLTGEASFCREQALANYWVLEQFGAEQVDGLRLIEILVEVKRLDDLGLRPDFIKIDVQGFEPSVVAGLHGTIAASQPVLLIERSGCSGALHRELAGLGYTAFVYTPRADTFTLYRDQPVQNLFFLPASDI